MQGGSSPPTPIEPPKTLQQISTINDKEEEEMEEEEEEKERNKEEEDKNKPLLKFHPRFATDYQVRTSPSKRVRSEPLHERRGEQRCNHRNMAHKAILKYVCPLLRRDRTCIL